MQKRQIMTDERVISTNKKLNQSEEQTNKNFGMVSKKIDSHNVAIQAFIENSIESSNRNLKEYIGTAINQAVQEIKRAISESTQAILPVHR